YTLSLHDALPIFGNGESGLFERRQKVLKHIKTPAHEYGDTNQEITFLFNICILLKTCLELSYLYFILLSVCFLFFVGKPPNINEKIIAKIQSNTLNHITVIL